MGGVFGCSVVGLEAGDGDFLMTFSSTLAAGSLNSLKD